MLEGGKWCQVISVPRDSATRMARRRAKAATVKRVGTVRGGALKETVSSSEKNKNMFFLNEEMCKMHV